MRRLLLGLAAILIAVPAFAQQVAYPVGVTPPVFIIPAAGVSGSGTMISAQIFAPDGAQGTPPYAFTSQTDLGWFKPQASFIGLSDSGVSGGVPIMVGSAVNLGSAITLGWTASTTAVASLDTIMARGGSAGKLTLSNGTATAGAELAVAGGSGAFISPVRSLTELTTIAAAPTTTTAIQLPANAVILAVTVRVVTVIPTATTFTVTSATPTKTWNTAAVSVAAGSTDPGTAPGPSFQTTASVITITPSGTPGTATGQVRVTVFYYSVTPATS